MVSAPIRFGKGATAEVGLDLKAIGAQRVMLVTDRNIAKIADGLFFALWDISFFEELFLLFFKFNLSLFDFIRLGTCLPFLHLAKFFHFLQPSLLFCSCSVPFPSKHPSSENRPTLGRDRLLREAQHTLPTVLRCSRGT